MNIFHEAAISSNPSNALGVTGLILLGIVTALSIMSTFFEGKKVQIWFFVGIMITIIASTGLLVASANILTKAYETANAQTISSLKTWSQNNYDIKLSQTDAEALIGFDQQSKPIAVNYKDTPTVIQLIEYKDGYILVNNKNQAVLSQDQ